MRRGEKRCAVDEKDERWRDRERERGKKEEKRDSKRVEERETYGYRQCSVDPVVHRSTSR